MSPTEIIFLHQLFEQNILVSKLFIAQHPLRRDNAKPKQIDFCKIQDECFRILDQSCI